MRLTDFSGAKIANVIGKIKKTSIIIILKHCIEQFSPKPRAFNIFYIDFYLWICNNFCYVDLASARSEAVDTIYILLNLGNENGEKNSNRSYLQENNLHVQHTFFYIFFAVVLHDYNVKLPETSWLPVKWRKCCTCTCSIFFFVFHVAHVYSGGSKHFSFSHRCNKISCCSSNNKCFLCFFLSLSSSFPRWALLACRPTFCFLHLSPPFSIFQIVGMTINLSLIYQTTHRNIFLFRLFNIDSLVAFAS